MYSWSCSCGDATEAPSMEAAHLAGELHLCRAGRMRDLHNVVVRAVG